MTSFGVSSPARVMMMRASFTLCLLALLDGYSLQTTVAHKTHRRHQDDGVDTPVICPGDKTVCLDDSTCCELSSGDFGCCPIPHAVCCADRIHCCPASTACDTQAGICQQKTAYANQTSLAIGRHNKNRQQHRQQQEHHKHHHHYHRQHHHNQQQQQHDETGEQQQMVEITNNNVDSAYSTPSRNAELRHRMVATPTHRFDGLHEPLELDGMTRQRAAAADAYWRRRLPFWQQQLSAAGGRTPMARVTTDVVCPDAKSKCPAHTTCCPIDGHDETYGCCPSENAVCCEDHLHCCPEHTRCDLSTGICVEGRNGLSRPWYKKFAATRIVRKPAVDLKPAMIRCHDDDENSMVPACVSGSKCCKAGLFDRFLQKHRRQRSAAAMTDAASHFCCALHDGVCCAGGMHCCPRGFRCSRGGLRRCVLESNDDDEESGQVSREATSAVTDDSSKVQPLITARSVETASSTLVEAELPESKETICADGSRCPAHNTCCPVRNPITDKVDAYKCCALSQAECCGESSCCPQGYQCVAGRRCEKTSLTDLIADFLHSHRHSHNNKESSLKNNKS